MIMKTESTPCKSNEKNKNLIMEQLWLTYFNDSLLKNRVITKNDHEKMRLMIKKRSFRKKMVDRRTKLNRQYSL